MEPERKIEKWLRAFAKKRREQSGAPIEMHPVTRRLLQSEAARRAPRPDGGNFFLTLRSLLRSRWAYGVGAAVVVIVAAVFLPLLSGRKPQQLARGTRTESSSATEDLAQKVAAPAEPAVPPPATALSQAAPTTARDAGAVDRRRDELKLKDDLAAKDVKQLPQPARAPVPGKPEAAIPLAAIPELAGAAAELPPAITAPKSLANAPLAAGSKVETFSVATTDADRRVGFDAPTAIAGTATTGLAQNQVQFRLITPETDAMNVTATRGSVAALGTTRAYDAVTNAPVLASFAVEQNGRAMRIVDSDGSVYSGYVQLEPASARVAADSITDFGAAPLNRAKESLDKAPLADSAQNYSFRVSGTNRSLRQSVVFAGNLVAITNAPQLGWNANAAAEVRSQTQPAAGGVAQPLLLNSRIQGTALIDNRRRLEINAAPLPPAPANR